MSAAEVSVVLFGSFGVLIALRVPVAFALGLACLPVLLVDDRLTPMLMVNEMWKSYNAFVLPAVPFFLLAANLMNAAGITDRLVALARALVGHLPGGLGHINVVANSMLTTTLMCPNPPGRCPTRARAKATSRSVIPAAFIRFAANKKKGTAKRMEVL